MSGKRQGVVEDRLLDRLGNAVGMRAARTTLLLDKRRGPADLEGSLDLVERVPVVAHDPAGFRDAAEFFGQLQQRQLSSSTLCQGGHSILLQGKAVCFATSTLPRRTGWSLFSPLAEKRTTCRIITELGQHSGTAPDL